MRLGGGGGGGCHSHNFGGDVVRSFAFRFRIFCLRETAKEIKVKKEEGQLKRTAFFSFFFTSRKKGGREKKKHTDDRISIQSIIP